MPLVLHEIGWPFPFLMPRKRERASLFYARKVLEEKEAEVSSLGPRMPGGRHMTFGEQI